MTALVGVLMGSKSDWPIMSHVCSTLDDLGVANEAHVLSAHRTPDAVAEYCATASERGLEVLVCGAGMAAALPGCAAAKTELPVLGVPMESKVNGLDSLLSMSQMPAGIPVGVLAIGRSGAVNAGLLAASILGLKHPEIREALIKFRRDQTERGLASSDPRAE